MSEEIWKQVPGYEKSYEVSDQGRVRSLERVVIRRNGSPMPVPSRIMACGLGFYGYPQLNLWNGETKPKLFMVHQLVAKAFMPNPSNVDHIDHIDGDRTNNKVSNLERVTLKENIQRAFRKGHVVRKLSPHDVLLIRAKKGRDTNEVANEFNVSKGMINAIHRGSAWGHLK